MWWTPGPKPGRPNGQCSASGGPPLTKRDTSSAQRPNANAQAQPSEFEPIATTCQPNIPPRGLSVLTFRTAAGDASGGGGFSVSRAAGAQPTRSWRLAPSPSPFSRRKEKVPCSPTRPHLVFVVVRKLGVWTPDWLRVESYSAPVHTFHNVAHPRFQLG